MTEEVKSLETLAKELFDAKKAETKAKAARIEAEEEIAKLVETDDNGSKTVPAGEDLKVVVKRKLNYKPDVDAIRAMNIPAERMPLTLNDPIPATYSFDQKAYEALRLEDAVMFAHVAEAVAVTPAKVSVTVKLA
jgi:hypothetical protein